MNQTLDNLTRLIGQEATMRLIEVYGGTAVYIPRASRCSETHELAQVIGLENLLAISRFYDRTMLSVPRGLELSRDIRNAEIRKLASEYNQRDLARRFGLTERQIRTILHEQKAPRASAPDNQLNLF